MSGRPEGLHYILIVFAAVTLSAHHSAAAKYDAAHAVTLTGTVSSFAWRNPHCFLYLDVDAGAFKGRPFIVEMSSASALAREGWTKSDVKPGDEIQLTVLPARVESEAAGLCRDGCEIRVIRSAPK